MRIFILIFTLFQFFACNHKTEKATTRAEKSINQPTRSMSTLKKLVLTQGDEDAYYELSNAYLDYEYPEEFLMYAMIMANKYNYPQAYFDVYDCIIGINRLDIKSIDENSASIAIKYLLKASEKEHEQAQEIVKEYSITDEIMDKKALIIKMNE